MQTMSIKFLHVSIFYIDFVCCCMQWVALDAKCNKRNKMYQQTNSLLIFDFNHLSWFRESCRKYCVQPVKPTGR